MKNVTLVSTVCLVDFREVLVWGAKGAEVGKAWKGWKKGQFQIHLIYTGVSESMFLISPDDTTTLLDYDDHDTVGRGKLVVPMLPNPDRHAGEWISRYAQRVNPQRDYVDYMMLTRYHLNHDGSNEFYIRKGTRDGKDYYLNGLSQAAEYLMFDKTFDHYRPGYDDPLSLTQEAADAFKHMKDFHDYVLAREKMKIEEFRLGETNQIAMKKDTTAYPGLSVRNVCASGCTADREGNICDSYVEHKKSNPVKFSENEMSLGMIFIYGDFKFCTAGDFSDSWELPSGKRFEIEDAIADVVELVNAAKINHHGHMSMTDKLAAVLYPRVVVNNVQSQLHTLLSVMERSCNQNLYPGGRIVCSAVFPAGRRAEDAGRPWLDILNPSSFDAGHVIANAEEGGKDCSVTYLTANGKSMTVKSVIRLES